VIFQLIDDHSRYAVASHVAWGETSEAAIVVFDKAVTAHGVPQRLLSDNGIALNPSRRGLLGRLVVHVMALGVKPITGKPYKPLSGQEGTLPPDPVPLPRQTAAGRRPVPAAGPGRRLRPHICNIQRATKD
jgi:transposase InsO family protein